MHKTPVQIFVTLSEIPFSLSVVAGSPDGRGEFCCNVLFGQEDTSLQKYTFLERQSIATNETRASNVLY